MMADLFDNPAGLDGFEFIEFSAPEKGVLEPVFESMGFTKIATHRSKDVELWRQGGINFITNYEPKSAAWYFSREHGPSACGMGFRVRNASKAYEHLMTQGAEPVSVANRSHGTAYSGHSRDRQLDHLFDRSLCRRRGQPYDL